MKLDDVAFDKIKAVYIDQSGSMIMQEETLEQMLEVADRCPNATLYGFDTAVWEVKSEQDLVPNRQGGGTAYPLYHAATNYPALILTDGLVGIRPNHLPLLDGPVMIFYYDHVNPPVDIREVYSGDDAFRQRFVRA